MALLYWLWQFGVYARFAHGGAPRFLGRPVDRSAALLCGLGMTVFSAFAGSWSGRLIRLALPLYGFEAGRLLLPFAASLALRGLAWIAVEKLLTRGGAEPPPGGPLRWRLGALAACLLADLPLLAFLLFLLTGALRMH